MTRATIPARRKHIYVYALLLLVPLFIAAYKPSPSHKTDARTRAAEVNKLANTLFR
jgi:hypothetical protein